jgi:hypothetical protein
VVRYQYATIGLPAGHRTVGKLKTCSGFSTAEQFT